tara:strand:+ start:620 stop:1030 length:411 start_codon:yes stop_codon:yes gene_type:complete
MPTNLVYPLAKENMLSGNIDLNTNPVFVALVSSSYTYSAAHEFFSPSVASHHIGATGSLSFPATYVTGSVTGSNVTFSSVSAGSVVGQVITFQSGTAGSADYLLAYFDTGSEGGISITTNGGDVIINWNGAGLFSL